MWQKSSPWSCLDSSVLECSDSCRWYGVHLHDEPACKNLRVLSTWPRNLSLSTIYSSLPQSIPMLLLNAVSNHVSSHAIYILNPNLLLSCSWLKSVWIFLVEETQLGNTSWAYWHQYSLPNQIWTMQAPSLATLVGDVGSTWWKFTCDQFCRTRHDLHPVNSSPAAWDFQVALTDPIGGLLDRVRRIDYHCSHWASRLVTQTNLLWDTFNRHASCIYGHTRACKWHPTTGISTRTPWQSCAWFTDWPAAGARYSRRLHHHQGQHSFVVLYDLRTNLCGLQRTWTRWHVV